MDRSIKVLILCDIFGKKYLPELLIKELCHKYDVKILDAYLEEHTFENEREAYDAFISSCGHERYYELVKSYCLVNQVDMIIGFSIGASVVWRICAENLKIKKAICFYPSQIRNHLELTPSFSCDIIFAKKEDSFNTVEVKKVLDKKDFISVSISEYNHGFMNPKSQNYSNEALKKYINYIDNCFLNIVNEIKESVK